MSTYKKITTLILIAILVATSCATRKRKEEVGGFKKFYHNLTAKYNGYFNANEIMKETYAGIEENHRDNYTDILPVYPETQIDPEKYKANLDKIIEKVTTVATIHDVSDYVDDCYVMMGQAQFLKQDYETAEETFEFFQEEFDPNDPSSRNYQKKIQSADDRRKVKLEERQLERKIKEEERKAKEKAKEEEIKKREDARKQREQEKEDARKRREEEKDQEKKRKEREQEIERKQREEDDKNMKNMSREDRKKLRDARLAAQREEARQEKEEDASTIAVQDEIKKDSTEKVVADANKVEKEIQKTIASEVAEPVEEDKSKIAEDNAEDYTPRKRDDDVKVEKSSYHEGVLWLAQTYIERERYTSADFLLRQLWDNPAVKESVKNAIPAARAHSAIMQKEYDEAKSYLKIATEIADGKNNRARYAYILAQLEEKSGNYGSARNYYNEAKKLGSDYELELNAELNMIKNDLLSRTLSPRNGEERLLDMRGEGKNIEFRDRISFILAEMAMAEPNIMKAEEYLKEALKYKTDNTNLQAEAYYLLAGINYNSDQFVNAKYYYDSTVTVMSKKDERYDEVEKLAKNLSAIATNIETIQTQDSLLRLGSLPESAQIEYAKEVLSAQKDNEDNDNGATQPVSISSKIQQVRQSRSVSTLKSDFFAYDQNSLSKGKEEFRDKWGDRSLQSNWRRSEALRISARPTETREEVTDTESEESDDKAIQEILDRLPNDPASIASAENKIENAYFQLGKLYRDNLENFPKSIEAYQTLLSRFPDSSKKLDVLYYLYLSYLDLSDEGAAVQYKNQIISEYPDSEYGKLLSDPMYAKSKLAEQRSLSTYYDDMYNHFSAGNYATVDQMMADSESKFGPTHELRPKFALLSAMTKGKLEGEEAYIKGLQEMITKYPGTAERTRAREILRFLKGDESAFDAVDINAVADLFEVENDKLHYIAIVVYNTTPESFDQTQVSISEYNKKFHNLKRLQLADITLNRSENIEIILVRKFANKEKAMEYYQDVIKRPRTFVPNNDVSYDVYPVTQRNYRKILEEKGINKYRTWFEKNYVNPEDNDKK